MRAFMPSDPSDKQKSRIEEMNLKAGLEEKKEQKKIETRRFIITTIIASIAAVAAVAGLLLQLFRAQ